MEILPGVGAMGALPPAVMGTHKLGGGAYLRKEEVPIREVMLHFAVTKKGPTVEELDTATQRPLRVVPKAEALNMMKQMIAQLRSAPPAEPAQGTPSEAQAPEA